LSSRTGKRWEQTTEEYKANRASNVDVGHCKTNMGLSIYNYQLEDRQFISAPPQPSELLAGLY